MSAGKRGSFFINMGLNRVVVARIWDFGKMKSQASESFLNKTIGLEILYNIGNAGLRQGAKPLGLRAD